MALINRLQTKIVIKREIVDGVSCRIFWYVHGSDVMIIYIKILMQHLQLIGTPTFGSGMNSLWVASGGTKWATSVLEDRSRSLSLRGDTKYEKTNTHFNRFINISADSIGSKVSLVDNIRVEWDGHGV